MKKLSILTLSILSALVLVFTMGCEDDNAGKGTLSLSLTDAPIDNADVTGVYVTINGLQYHMQDSEWKSFEGFEGPKTVNLLELTDGVTELLGNFEMEAGTYTQLRFMLDAPERGAGSPSSPGCYIKFTNGDSLPLFVPSGGQSGYKAVGEFSVPTNGTVEVTADFDARKSVVDAGATDRYILKPTIRLIVDNQAGSITGGVSNIADSTEIVVLAYEDGTYSDSEAADPDVEENRFPNAVSSDMVDETGEYKLSYLAPMTYDLVIASYIDGTFQEVLGQVQDVAVESKKTTSQPIDLSSL